MTLRIEIEKGEIEREKKNPSTISINIPRMAKTWRREIPIEKSAEKGEASIDRKSCRPGSSREGGQTT